MDGGYRLTYEPQNPVPVEDWLADQKRFAHLLRPENRTLVEQVQQRVDEDWEALVRAAIDQTSTAPAVSISVRTGSKASSRFGRPSSRSS